jgi:hypothetical protein
MKKFANVGPRIDTNMTTLRKLTSMPRLEEDGQNANDLMQEEDLQHMRSST